MANYTAIAGIIDQVGGSIIVPDSVLHIPRYQGNFFTLPAGLQIKGDRKYVWSVNTLLPGVIGITNVNSPTPTIEFDGNIYSEVSLIIRCTIVGQPRNFKEYLVFTAPTSTIQTSVNPFNTVSDNNFYNVTNVLVSIANESSLINGSSTNYLLGWNAPTSSNINYYLIEVWNGTSFNFFTLTSNSTIPITNPLITYRVKPIYLSYYAGVSNFAYSSLSYNDNLLLGASFIKAQIQSFNKIVNYNQTASIASFFASIELTSIESNVKPFITAFNKIVNYNQNTNAAAFFASVELTSIESKINSQINSFNKILGYNQTPSNAIFWAETIGT